jgi:hypothetical protein
LTAVSESHEIWNQAWNRLHAQAALPALVMP